jgi:hypothetical protein
MVLPRGAQRGEFGPRGFDNAPVQLKEQGSAVGKLGCGGVDEPAVSLETFPVAEDGVGGSEMTSECRAAIEAAR